MIDQAKKKRLRRSMLFLNCQKPSLIRDPYIYHPDSIILDLEDAVAENQKDAARFSLYHALQEVDYRGVERVVRINGLDTPHWQEDVRVSVAGGADVIRIPKCVCAQDIQRVEEAVRAAEKEFGVPEVPRCLWAPWNPAWASSTPWKSAGPASGSSAWLCPAAILPRICRLTSPSRALS